LDDSSGRTIEHVADNDGRTRHPDEHHPAATIFGPKKEGLPVTFVLVSVPRLAFAIVAIHIAFGLVWGSAKRTGIMKDNLVPQIEPRRQTYSLTRWQMAFWFTLIFASYVFL